MWRQDQELLDDFVAETMEHVDAIERELLELESKPESQKPAVDALFRAAHSVKGNAGLFGFDGVMGVAHAMENVLGRMRTGELAPAPPVVSALLLANERLGSMIGDLDHAAAHETSDVLTALKEFERPRKRETSLTLGPPTAKSTPPAATVRVPIGRLDELAGAAQELGVARRALLDRALTGDLDAVVHLAEVVDTLGDRLERAVAALRVMPAGSMLGRFRRVARDLSMLLRKDVQLRILGEEVEVEKPLLEALADPIGHLVRNAIDHGLEEPKVRRGSGKPERGLVEIRISHDDRGLLVEVSDDGRGIDPQRVAKTAVERGLVDAEALAAVTDDQLLALVFEPGFTTAREITDVSGRGVGMDVVREGVHRVGGTIDLRSAVGVGTTISLRVPSGPA